MDNDNESDYDDDFDPSQDNNASPGQWAIKAWEIFYESEEDWINKVTQLADMHPLAITRLKFGAKDAGIILSKHHLSIINQLEKKGRGRWLNSTEFDE